MTPAEQAYIVHRCACFEYDEKPQPWELFQAQFEQVAAIEAAEPAPAPDAVDIAPARDYRIHQNEEIFLSRRRSSKKRPDQEKTCD
jgi:hypothetical protein